MDPSLLRVRVKVKGDCVNVKVYPKGLDPHSLAHGCCCATVSSTCFLGCPSIVSSASVMSTRAMFSSSNEIFRSSVGISLRCVNTHVVRLQRTH